jgi:hypothetical protein
MKTKMRNLSLHLTLAAVTLLCASCMSSGLVRDRVQVIDSTPDPDVEKILSYRALEDRSNLMVVDDRVRASFNSDEDRAHMETQMILVLRSATSSLDARRFACQELALIGTDRCVPDLAVNAVSGGDLCDMARYALESIPTPLADQAFLEALSQTSDSQRVGIVNALGRRRVERAIPALAALLSSSDALVARSATAALGNIGTAMADKALTEAASTIHEEAKVSLADARLLCADRLLADGHPAAALVIYKDLHADSQPRHIRMAAVHGQLKANPTGRTRIVNSLLENSDAEFRAMGVRLVEQSDDKGSARAVPAAIGD